MTEKEKMTAGLIYQANDRELIRELNEVKDLCWEYNRMRPTLLKERNALLQRILGKADEDTFINQPFYCDYGKHIRVGKRFFANFCFTVLDEAFVTIGDDCFIGPNVSIYTACHSTDPTERNTRQEWAKTVTIGEREGEFPGMLHKRTFIIVPVSANKAQGYDPEAKGIVVKYDGKKVTKRI